jgi:hypothetical protein
MERRNAQVRREDLIIVDGPLSDVDEQAKIPEPIKVTVATPRGMAHYDLFYHNGDLVLEFTEPETFDKESVVEPSFVPVPKKRGRPKK